MKSSGAIDEGFLGRTYRSTALLTGVVLLYLYVFGQVRLVLPVTLGVLLSLAMLYGNELGVKRYLVSLTYSPEKKEEQKRPGSRTVLAFVLIKYALVGLSAYAVARFTAPLWQIAFVGGFCLTHMNIAMRTVSRLLLGMNESDTRGNLRATID